jgi:hypothetical protein
MLDLLASAPMKEPIFLAIILFRLCDGEILEDDDFSTSAIRIPMKPTL